MVKGIQHLKPHSKQVISDPFLADRAAFELYQAFMVGYVRRLNQATFNVTIGGVRIGSAKYSRLAQINIKSRIITFSRFAVENVPERGRRYLVLHELAHVKEVNHNKRFWTHVERFEPNYRKVSRELEQAFKKNVKEDQRRIAQLKMSSSLTDNLAEPKLLLSSRLLNHKINSQTGDNALIQYNAERLASPPVYEEELAGSSLVSMADPFKYQCEEELYEDDDSYECMEDQFSSWDDEDGAGTTFGGCPS